MPFLPTPFVAAGLVALGLLAAVPAQADTVAPAGAPLSIRPAAPSLNSLRQAKEAKEAAEAGTPAKAAPTKAAPAEAEDPMDKLRRRLAEKLAGEDAKANPNVLRVVTRPSTLEPPAAVKPPRPRPNPAAATRKAGDGHTHWAYEGEGGPERWAQLNPEFAACAKGTRQSPIDIRDGIAVQLDPVLFDYRPSNFKVIDNGHTVQVNVPSGNSIEVVGRRFELVQFHFHRPSEERINGRQFDMVVHLVHKDTDGRLAVVAVLLDRGSVQPVIQSVWNNLPLERNEEVPARAQIDLNALLPAERGYYTYMGSLTTPPCSEGVLWMVMKQPVGIAPEQIGVFSRLYPMNARPVQASAGRLIKGSR